MSEPSNSLKILIVGAGISGLAAAVRLAQHGHHVQIIERTPILNPSGGGIQVSPGVIKIFRHWGLERDFLESGVDVMEKLRFHTWGDGTLLRSLDREEAKGHEVSWYLHRGAIQPILYNAAVRLGVEVIFNATLGSLDATSDHPSVILEDGRRLRADLIIGADGYRSQVRTALGIHTEPSPTSGVLFQASIPRTVLKEDPYAARFTEDQALNLWMGPGRDVMVKDLPKRGYLDCQFTDDEYVSLIGAAPWKSLSDTEYVRRRFENFAPGFDVLLAKVDNLCRYKVRFVGPLSTWRSESGKVVLIGDAAHAMGPYAGQGAAQSIEDAAVLSELLTPSTSSSSVPHLTALYEGIRKDRAEKIHAFSLSTRDAFILSDGPEAEARNEMFRGEAREFDGRHRGARSEWDVWLEDWDAFEEVRKVLREEAAAKEEGVPLPKCEVLK